MEGVMRVAARAQEAVGADDHGHAHVSPGAHSTPGRITRLDVLMGAQLETPNPKATAIAAIVPGFPWRCISVGASVAASGMAVDLQLFRGTGLGERLVHRTPPPGAAEHGC